MLYGVVEGRGRNRMLEGREKGRDEGERRDVPEGDAAASGALRVEGMGREMEIKAGRVGTGRKEGAREEER